VNRTAWAALAVTAVIAALVVAMGDRAPFFGGAGEVRTTTHRAPLGGIRGLEATLRMGAGGLTVRTTDGDSAYEATITQNAVFNTQVSFHDGRLRIADRAPRRLGISLTNQWTVALNRRVPIELEASTGAGRATFDLTGLSGSAEITAGAGEVRVAFTAPGGSVKVLEFRGGVGRFEAMGLGNAGAEEIEVRAGVGEFHLDFSGEARGTARVEMRGGVGRMELVIPAGVGVRIKARGGVNRLRLAGFTQVGDGEYVNTAWETAPARLEISASLGVGDFVVSGR